MWWTKNPWVYIMHPFCILKLNSRIQNRVFHLDQGSEKLTLVKGVIYRGVLLYSEYIF